MARRTFRGPRSRRWIVAGLVSAGLAAGFALDRVDLRGVTVDPLTSGGAPGSTTTAPATAPLPRPDAPGVLREASLPPRPGAPFAPPPVAGAATRATVAAPGRAGPRAGPFADGLAALRSGDAHAAVLAFETARSLAPHAPEILANLGFAYLALGRTDEATAAFERAITIAPMFAGPYYGLAQSAEARGDLETARGAMRTYLHLAPENDGFRRKAMAALWEWTQPAAGIAAAPSGDMAPDAAAGERAAHARASGNGAAGPATPEAAPVVAAGPAAANGILEAPLATLDGDPVTLAAFAGRLVVLNIWAAWCGPCRAELPSLDRLAAGLDPARAAVIGVSMDREPAFTREFLRQLGVRFTSFWDGDGSLTRDILGVRALPLTLVLDPGGTVLLRHEGALDWSAPDIAAAIGALAGPGGASDAGLARLAEAVR